MTSLSCSDMRCSTPWQGIRPVKPARQLTRRDLADQVSAFHARMAFLSERLSQAEAREAEVRTRADQAERERNMAAQDREQATAWAVSAEGEAKALRAALAEAQAGLAEARRPAWQRWFGIPG